MKLTSKDILQIIESEIEWCKSHPEKDASEAWNNGFLAGLHQVKYIIMHVEEHGATPRQITDAIIEKGLL